MVEKIDGVSSLRGASAPKRAGGVKTSGNFASHLEETQPQASVSGVSGVAHVQALLGIQEVDDAANRASKGKKRALAMLDVLDDMRMGIVHGGVSPDKLQQLRQTIQSEKTAVDDPHLRDILDAIDLRAQVERAKYER